MKTFMWFLFLIFSISACDIQEGTVASPDKPEQVPEQAFWIGGHEGGAFILISNKKENNEYFGAVYFDTTGEVWYEGQFNYTGDAPFDVANKSSYTAWNGDFLFLENGEKLIAVDESR